MKRLLFVAILVLASCLLHTSKADAEDIIPRYEQTKCPIDFSTGANIECGNLITFEDYNDMSSRLIRSAVVIIHSPNENPLNEAVLFTEGGPGFTSFGEVGWLASTPFSNERDIVVLEQRGNKYSEPRLWCSFSSSWGDIEGDTPCIESLLQKGIALENYTSSSIAADIDALKQVLDYDSWILFGTSYSTRPMQLVLENYPEDVRSAVLLSTSPVTDNRYLHDAEHTARVLQVMFDDCAADSECAKAYPDLEDNLYRLVQEFNDEPIDLELTFPNSTERFTFEVNGDTLLSWLVGDAFYGPAYPPYETAYLPLLITKLSQGNKDLLYPWASEYISRWGEEGFSWGLYFAVNCQDDAPYVDQNSLDAQLAAYPELDGYLRHREELDICAAAGLEASPPLATEPVESDIPVLVMAGSYDPITPFEWGLTATVNMTNRTLVEFPSTGHSVVKNNPCAVNLISNFMENPMAELDLSCVADSPAPEFELPGRIIIAPAMYEIHFNELGYSMLEENLFLGSWLTLIGTGVVAIVTGLVLLVRRRRQSVSNPTARFALPLLIILAITSLVWGYALRFSLQAVAADISIVLRFGLPASYWWIFVVALLIGGLTITLMVITVLGWIRKYWSLPGRIAITITSLAAITFCGVLAKWGMFTALLK
jgi:pimeloyl-ACP methyl ester carboxylesterase